MSPHQQHTKNPSCDANEEPENGASSSSRSSSSGSGSALRAVPREDPTPSHHKTKQDTAAGKDSDDDDDLDDIDAVLLTTTAAAVSSPTTVVAGLAGPEEAPPPLAIRDDDDTNNDADDDNAWPLLPASRKSRRTSNPIRAIVDPVLAAAAAAASNSNSATSEQRRPHRISLALGDPTAHLEPCPAAAAAVVDALRQPGGGGTAGYANACGTDAARRAVAAHHHSSSAEHVVVAGGCSGALELALTALLDGGDDGGDGSGSILLVPQPGFPLYQVIAESHGAAVAPYRLRGEDGGWRVDLEHARELVRRHGPRVRGMVVNNPGNPTGAVYPRSHLREIVQFGDAHRVPLVADEVYGDLIVADDGGSDGDGDDDGDDGDCQFHPLADVADELGRRVPVITASGLGKQYLLPGWRVGWIVFQDNIFGSLWAVEAGAKRLAQVALGASHLAQAAVPALLDPRDGQVREWKACLRRQLREQASALSARLRAVPGLDCGNARGALYLLVGLRADQLDDAVGRSDVEFCQRLLQEQNVFLLPGSCFGAPGSVRAVFCAPVPVLEEAADRIAAFCRDHRRR